MYTPDLNVQYIMDYLDDQDLTIGEIDEVLSRVHEITIAFRKDTMFKILVTTIIENLNNGSIHTTIIKFASKEEADFAANLINTEATLGFKQYALRLYDGKRTH